MEAHQPQRGLRSRAVMRLARAAAVVAWLVVIAWLIGRVVSDRYVWSQFLLWIPTPVVLLTALVGLFLAFRSAVSVHRRRACTAAWLAVILLIGLYFGLIEHRFFYSRPSPVSEVETITLLNWNASYFFDDDREQLAQPVIDINPDLAILTDARMMHRLPNMREWVKQEGMAVRSLAGFVIASKLSIRTMRSLVESDGITIALLEVDAQAALGQALTIYLVDLPSDLHIGRMETALRARRMLKQSGAPPADVIVGDFNMTRDSAALAAMFPEHRHAYDEAGSGYGATYHRALPLYHIDHVLLGEQVAAQMYNIMRPRESRHCIQVARLMRKAN